jgi:hypothetical protein
MYHEGLLNRSFHTQGAEANNRGMIMENSTQNTCMPVSSAGMMPMFTNFTSTDGTAVNRSFSQERTQDALDANFRPSKPAYDSHAHMLHETAGAKYFFVPVDKVHATSTSGATVPCGTSSSAEEALRNRPSPSAIQCTFSAAPSEGSPAESGAFRLTGNVTSPLRPQAFRSQGTGKTEPLIAGGAHAEVQTACSLGLAGKNVHDTDCTVPCEAGAPSNRYAAGTWSDENPVKNPNASAGYRAASARAQDVFPCDAARSTDVQYLDRNAAGASGAYQDTAASLASFGQCQTSSFAKPDGVHGMYGYRIESHAGAHIGGNDTEFAGNSFDRHSTSLMRPRQQHCAVKQDTMIESSSRAPSKPPPRVFGPFDLDL